VRVGVEGELFADLRGQGPDLLVQGSQNGEVSGGDPGLGGTVVAGGAAGSGGQAGMQDSGCAPA
jgi:hypothetical protein